MTAHRIELHARAGGGIDGLNVQFAGVVREREAQRLAGAVDALLSALLAVAPAAGGAGGAPADLSSLLNRVAWLEVQVAELCVRRRRRALPAGGASR